MRDVTNVALLGLNFDACSMQGTQKKARGSVIVITHWILVLNM